MVGIYGPVSRVPTPPPWDGGGVWCPCGGVYTYIHTYIPTYLPTYLRTYIHTITLPYITLPYLTLPYLTFHTYIHTITLPYLTLHSIHTYIHRHTHTYIHTYVRTYVHTYIPAYIPTYQHTNIPPPQATGGGTRRTIPPPQATGGGDQKNHTTTTGHRGGTRRTRRYCPPIPIGGGGEGGWPTLHHIYIYTVLYSHILIHLVYPFMFHNSIPIQAVPTAASCPHLSLASPRSQAGIHGIPATGNAWTPGCCRAAKDLSCCKSVATPSTDTKL